MKEIMNYQVGRLQINPISFMAYLSHDAAPQSELMPRIKSDKPLVVYRFSGNVMKRRFFYNVTYI